MIEVVSKKQSRLTFVHAELTWATKCVTVSCDLFQWAGMGQTLYSTLFEWQCSHSSLYWSAERYLTRVLRRVSATTSFHYTKHLLDNCARFVSPIRVDDGCFCAPLERFHTFQRQYVKQLATFISRTVAKRPDLEQRSPIKHEGHLVHVQIRPPSLTVVTCCSED